MCDDVGSIAAAAAVRYQPLYIESFLEHRTNGQTIEEWTQQEGQHMFAAADIYKPVTISVPIQGHSNNCFAVDMSKVDWHAQLTSAVKSTLIAAQLAAPTDAVSLATVRGDSIADATMHGLRQLGVVYPLVNGKKPQSASTGHIATPATHAINRDELLAQWTADVCEKCIPVIAQQAAQATSARDLDERLFGEQTKELVRATVEKHGGHLPTFQKVVEVHGDPSLLSALEEKTLSHEAISSEIANHVLKNVESVYQAHVADVTAYFKAQEVKSLQSKGGLTPQGKRTIFGSAAAAAAIGEELANAVAVENAFPTAMKLHKTILGKALSGNTGLEQNIGFSIRIGPRRRTRRHRHHHEHKHPHGGNHHHHKDQGQVVPGETAEETMENTRGMTPEERAFRNRLLMGSQMSNVNQVASVGENLFGEDEPERLMETMRRRHELARLPPSPGVVCLDQEQIGARAKSSKSGGGKSNGKVHMRGHLDPAHSTFSDTTVTSYGRSGGGGGGPSASHISADASGWDRLSIGKTNGARSEAPPSLETFEGKAIGKSVASDVPELEAVPLAKKPASVPTLSDEPPALEKVGAHMGVRVAVGGGKGAYAHVHAHAGRGHHPHPHHHSSHVASEVPASPAQEPGLPSLDFLKAKNGIVFDGRKK